MQGALTPWGAPIPRTSLPPIVFVTGHDSVCPDPKSGELPFFNLTFGNFDAVVNQTGRVAMVFELCYAPNRPGLATVAARFSELAASMRYDDGQPVREIDVVAHNLGGLMVRSYLAQGLAGPRIRRIIFLGVPHFGTSVASFRDPDPQLREASLGSRWLFDLATWNQGSDNLRGTEAIAIAGTAGTNTQDGVTDSVVTVNSAALDFVAPGRTIVLPLCHTQGGIGQLFLCAGAPGLANVNTSDQPTARIALAFLNGFGDEWRTVARSVEATAPRSRTAGLLVERRTADNVPVPIASATVIAGDGTSVTLERSTEGLAYTMAAPAGKSRLIVDGREIGLDLRAEASQAVSVKPGPFITSVEPYPGALQDRVLAPGMLVRVRGQQLAQMIGTQPEVLLAGQPVRVLASTQAGEVVGVLPDSPRGVVDLTLRNSLGKHMVQVVIEDVAPVILRSEAGNTAVVQSDKGLFTLYLTGTRTRSGAGLLSSTRHKAGSYNWRAAL
jgi:hypothetical protein